MLCVLIRSAYMFYRTDELLMSTHNIFFYEELEKIIPDLPSNTPL